MKRQKKMKNPLICIGEGPILMTDWITIINTNALTVFKFDLLNLKIFVTTQVSGLVWMT